MCGICGIVYAHPERPVSEEMLRRMTQIMHHRGPDSQGSYIAPGVGLGMCRLSIIDLETGDQPIFNEDGTVAVVCNGEIYNSQELRKELMSTGHRFRSRSDVEVIVHLYEDHGVQCLNRLRGMFGFALWDARRRRLMLARDRLGIKPLLYALQPDGGLVFGSELNSILMAGTIQRQVDVRALGDLFTLGFILGPRTLFSTIRRVLPGHYLLYQDGGLSIHQYWDLRFPPLGEAPPPRRASEWAERLRAKLEESVRIHLQSDVPMGAWLSGGIDSSAVVGLMGRMTNRPVQTFTLAFENPDFDEVSGQRSLSDFAEYNLSNQRAVFTIRDFGLLPKAVWHSGDPHVTAAEIPRMLLSRLASNSVKVVLSGEGSDEAFGGYSWFRVDKLLRPFTRLPRSWRRFLARVPAIKTRWSRAARTLAAPAEMDLARYRQLLDSAVGDCDDDLFSNDVKRGLPIDGDSEDTFSLPMDFKTWHPFAQLQYLETKVRLPNSITRSLDSTSMAYSLEARVPFLDHELVELCALIPPALKMKRLQEKHILRLAMRDDLPADILRRRKRPLSAPFEQWLRDLPDFGQELLSENRLREKGYFTPQVVVRMLERHRAGKANYARQLMLVLGVQLWDDLFMRGSWPS